MEHNSFHSVEMQMNTGGGNLTLHHSDLHSKRNVSSAEMQMDSGHGHDTLHYSDLYSHKAVPSAEIPMKSGHGHIALHHSYLYSHEAVPPAEMQMNTTSGNLVLHHSDLHSKRNVSSAEMPTNSGSGHIVLHHSDLHSKRNVSSAEMPTNSGGGHIALHHSHLYSHKAVPPSELQMDRGGGDICYAEQGDELVVPAAEYSESSSENEGSSSHEYSVCDMHEQLSEYNEDQPEDLSVGQKHTHSSCFTSVQDNDRKASSHNQSQGPIVLLGHSLYFVSLYKHVYTLTALAEKYHYDLRFIEDEVQVVKWWAILDKHQLEYMKTEMEIMLGDNNVELDLPSDLTDTDEEGNGGKDGNETDGNSSSSSIREVVYDSNACEKYIKPAKEHNLPPISGTFTNPPDLQHLPKCSSPSASVLQNVPKGYMCRMLTTISIPRTRIFLWRLHEESSRGGFPKFRRHIDTFY